MKKRFLVLTLAVALCLGICLFAACSSLEKTVTDISASPDVLTVELGSSVDVIKEGITVKVTYSNGKSAKITDYTIRRYKSDKLGEQTVIVKYGDAECNLKIEVINTSTFKAATVAEGNVDINIGKTIGNWKNSIDLEDSEGRTVLGMIPTKNIVPAFDADHYTWDGALAFNLAKINSESQFWIDDDQNAVQNYANGGRTGSNGYYYDYFFIHNADAQNAINSLNFEIDTVITISRDEAGDTACDAFAAFIIFDSKTIPVGSTIPADAVENAGKTVVITTADPFDSVTQIKEDAPGEGYRAWFPFAAWTYAIEGNPDDTADSYQYADLDVKTGGTYDFNLCYIENLPTQQTDGEVGFGEGKGFILDTDSIRVLNGKSGKADTESGFTMAAQEIYRVDLYYWFDGYSMIDFTDITVTDICVKVTAAP